jgi:hypothetical protein
MRKKMGAGGRKRGGGSCTTKGARAAAAGRQLVTGCSPGPLVLSSLSILFLCFIFWGDF